MKLKVLTTPIKITVSLMYPSYGLACLNPEYRPFKDLKFEATAKAAWCNAEGEIKYISIRKDRRQYLVRVIDLTVLSIMAIQKDINPTPYLMSFEDAGQKYSIEELAVDLLLLKNYFEPNITWINYDSSTPNRIEFIASYKGQFDWNVKPVNDAKVIVVCENQDFTIML